VNVCKECAEFAPQYGKPLQEHTVIDLTQTKQKS